MLLLTILQMSILDVGTILGGGHIRPHVYADAVIQEIQTHAF